MINLTSFIEYHARTTPDRPAIVYEQQTISYSELLGRAECLAGYLVERGIQPGDVIAVLMKNSPAFLEIAFAVSHIGAVFLPINFRLSEDEVNYICENSEARLLFADSEFEAMDLAVQRVCLGPGEQTSTRSLSDICVPAPMHAVAGRDLFRLMYTSGTTDRPKGVMHSYNNFFWKSADHVVVLGLSNRSRLLVVGPLYHVGAFDLPGIAVLWQGGMLAIQRDFDADAALSAIERYRLNSAWLAPIMTSTILGWKNRDKHDVSTMDWIVGGGERTPENRIREFSEFFTNARYIDAYGLTESCSGDSFMVAGRELEKIGSTGQATPHVEIQIRDENGKRLPENVDGEICLRGPKIFSGYWRDEEKTAASFFGDWFRTGDIGFLDAESFLYLTDRKKDMIISGGENIASSELERVIRLWPEVDDVAVVGRKDSKWGEVPVAVVVPTDGSELDFESLVAHCKTKLAAFKVPKDLIIRDALPRNPSGKVLKRQLRDEINA